ncbi:MAG TPA: GlsB/YeaQ/YmgE family stress response membrane protein [Candidatus Limnocylindrales bacterium]
MLDMSLIGWIVVGLVAGWLSGLVVRGGEREGCLTNLLIGVLGGIVGGYIAQAMKIGDPRGFLGAVVVAFVGAVIVRVLINAVSGRPRR